MVNLLNRNNKHLFLEKPDKSDNSFIANINSLSKSFRGLTSEDVLALKDIPATIVSTGEEWKLILEETALDLLAGATAFNTAIVTKITEDVPANSEITLPNIAKYIVGTNMLMLSYNGTVCYLGEQFEEIGEPHTDSNKIKILFDLRTDDVLEFRVIALNANVSNSAVIAEGSTEPRTLASRFSDIVNVKDFGAVGDGVTDDAEAINIALSIASNNNNLLIFPSGTYNITQNLTNFRNVRKIGTGVIKRGTYIYSITPTTQDTNTFYVSPNGNVTNDGLTPETPITIGTAISSMRYLVGASDIGQWKIHMLPGIYTDTGVRISYLPHFSKPLILEGEREILSVSTSADYSDDFLYYTDDQCTSVPYVYSPDTWLEAKRAGLWRQRPTVTWDGTNSIEHYALRMSRPGVIPLTLYIQDITFANWKHTGFEGNSGGTAIDCCVTYSLRCRFYNCGVGEWYRSGQSTHKQNVYRNCGTGTRGQYSHSGTIGDVSGGTCLFSGCDVGMHVGRGSVMHNDGNHYTGCNYSCETAYLSRNAIVGGVYYDWNIACFSQYNNSMVTNPESATFLSAPDGNKPISLSRYGSLVESGGEGIQSSIVGYSFPNTISMIHTGSTERTLLQDSNYGRIATISKRTCAVKGTIDSGMIIRVHVNVSISGTGGATLQLANTSGEGQSLATLSIPNGAAYSGWAIFEIVVKSAHPETGKCIASGRAYIEQSNTVNKTNISSSLWTSAMVGDTFDANVLRWYATLGNASDTLTIGGWYTELWR